MQRGIETELGGTVYVVPPLLIRDMKFYQEKIGNVMSGTTPDFAAVVKSMDAVIEISLPALKRNYPDMTLAQLEEVVDVSNFMELFNNVMDISGLRRKAIDAEKAKASSP